MLRAVIFDFNGVIVNDEPIHFELFRRVLREQGLHLTEKDYYARYLGMDDRGCFSAAFRDQGKELSEERLAALVERKADYYRREIRDKISLFPGVQGLVSELAEKFPLAIASGALRHEIELILSTAGLRRFFSAIVSAEDVIEGKPAPEIFLKTLARLNSGNTGRPIAPAECLVIEDSKEGIRGAAGAGMKCLAVANSHPAEQLKDADAVVQSLEKVDLPLLYRLFSQ